MKNNITETAAGVYKRNAREISDSCDSLSIDIRETTVLDSPTISLNSDRVSMKMNEMELALGGGMSDFDDWMNLSTVELEDVYGLRRNNFIGWCRDIGNNLRNRFGIAFDARHLIQLTDKISDIFWTLIGAETGIIWALQFGTKIYECIAFDLFDTEKINAKFLFDKFTWSVVDAAGVYTPHEIVGIAKYDEPSGWNDQKLITAQALLENYYSKEDLIALSKEEILEICK